MFLLAEEADMENNISEQETRDDRRVFERRDFSSLLRFNLGAKNINGEGITRNISAGGVAFITKNRLSPRQPVELWIDVPDGQNPIHKTAQVTWAKEKFLNSYEAGVKFDSVGLMELSRIFKNFSR